MVEGSAAQKKTHPFIARDHHSASIETRMQMACSENDPLAWFPALVLRQAAFQTKPICREACPVKGIQAVSSQYKFAKRLRREEKYTAHGNPHAADRPIRKASRSQSSKIVQEERDRHREHRAESWMVHLKESCFSFLLENVLIRKSTPGTEDHKQ